MKKIFSLISIALLLVNCTKKENTIDKNQASITSPNGEIKVFFQLDQKGSPFYRVQKNNKVVIDTSYLGLKFKNQSDLNKNFKISTIEKTEVDQTWEQPWGEERKIQDHHKQLQLQLQETSKTARKLNITFKVFNDGVGFRYHIPEQENLKGELVITDEITQFRLTNDHKSWWIPADYDSYEYNYSETKLSEIDAQKAGYAQRHDRNITNFHAVNTPITMQTEEGLMISIHEANLTDYAGMTLGLTENNTLNAELVPWENGDKVRTKAPFSSPWRSVMINEEAKDLITNYLILNLNEPNKLEGSLAYAQPMKYTGIWWEMHLGKSTWGRKDDQGNYTTHGATTENAMKYINFNKKHKIKGLLIEGWNTGWEYWGAQDTIGFFDFVTPYDDFDINKVVAAAKENNIEIIGHHETSGDANNYENRMEKAFQFYEDLGIHAIKTGYAGGIVPKGEFHHGQYMVRHHQKVIETAAKHQLAINAHEPIKATGLRRTYPNFMTREGVRGMEFNGWSHENPPSHTAILPFTRILGGPVDYTPGIFQINLAEYRKGQAIQSTLANQLALYVVLYSPMQMAADLPENYAKYKDAFQFIEAVGVDWETTKVIDAKIGDYVSIARKQRDSDNWFVGSVTDENARELKIPFSFLDKNSTYKATIYKDAKNADFEKNPSAYKIEEVEINSTTVYQAKLAAGGGVAIAIQKI
ncbi:glycoside hydrolase family 97 protein [Mesonia aestuariivivens]|uniref:Glycoside hydrolase family 97 protein n=1 Tax=Mesonia aestuariivivens TaxID=2796128 RepID=A0ABS6W2A0_9FLAO|nr:glycoside hydrolase family 97 protein [Mesonia aestuariivivens]MBW2961986.1 glycoside hydrolase family 97 protein [Mesonia aestuariivivens]